MANKKVSTEPKEKVPVSVKQVLSMLEAGKDRAEIGKELGLTRADVMRMFKHPELKGQKVKRTDEALNGFVFVDEPTDGEAKGSTSADGTVTDAAKTEDSKATVSDAATEKW